MHCINSQKSWRKSWEENNGHHRGFSLISHLALSFLMKQDAKLVLSFSLLNAGLPLVCTILEAHKWNNLVLSVMAPQTEVQYVLVM